MIYLRVEDHANEEAFTGNLVEKDHNCEVTDDYIINAP